MAKIDLTTLGSGYNSTTNLNDNFQAIEDEFNNKVLYRDNPAGEANAMQNDFDMNSNRILNLPSGTTASEPATYGQLLAAASGITSITTLSEEQNPSSNGQALFTFSGISYTPGAKNLVIYRNGVKIPRSLYTETSTTSVTLNASLAALVSTTDAFEFEVNQRDVDSSTYLASNATYTPSGTGAVATDVQTKLREFVSVKDFGATGDGVTDDTAAIQAAIDAGAKFICFPAGGTYYIASGLTFSSNQHYYGHGAILDGGAGRTVNNVLPVGADNIQFEGLEFTRFNRPIAHSADVSETPITNLRIHKCEFNNCNQGVYMPWYVNACWITENYFKDITYAGATSAIQIGKQESSRFAELFTQSEYVISGNVIDTVTNTDTVAADTHGVIARGYSVKITDNSFRDITFGAASGTGCEGVYVVSWNSSIKGNTFYNAGNREASLTLKGAYDDGALPTGSLGYNNIIANNHFYSDTTDASAIYNQCDYTLICDNIIEGFDDAAIKCTANGNDCYIHDNVFQRLTTTVGVNSSDGKVNVCNNIFVDPIGQSGTTFYSVFVSSASEAVTEALIKDNSFSLTSDCVATTYYDVYFNAAGGNNITNVVCYNKSTSTSPSATAYGVGFIGVSGTNTTNIRCGGHYSGSWDQVVRYNSGTYKPTNVVLEFDPGAMIRTANGATTVNRWESGTYITNEGASGTITAPLPLAEQNLVLTFIRTDTQTFRVDPNASENIRGNAAGKYASLDSDGASLTLKCVEAGIWDVISSTGTITYEP